MNENEAKLVAALRSGEFTQGTGHLRPADDKYCCLGVACELYRREFPTSAEWDEDYDPAKFMMLDDSDDDSDTSLPDEVRQWLGWTSTDGEVANNHDLGTQESSLAGINDAGYTFEEIAQLIEGGFVISTDPPSGSSGPGSHSQPG